MLLYLSLSAVHVSDSLVHYQERRFGAVYRNWYKPDVWQLMNSHVSLLLLFVYVFTTNRHIECNRAVV